jgi:hypothetical protein
LKGDGSILVKRLIETNVSGPATFACAQEHQPDHLKSAMSPPKRVLPWTLVCVVVGD